MNWGATDRSGWDSIFGPLMSDLRTRVIREQSFRSSLGPFEVYNIVHRLLLLLVFLIMSIVLVRGTHSYISSGERSDWLVYLQVTGASGFVGSHVVSELLREGYTVRGFVHAPQSYSVILTSVGIISAVRSHNAPHVTKSYESFGDKFSAVVIDDLITSDLQAAVRGTRCADAAVLHLITL